MWKELICDECNRDARATCWAMCEDGILHWRWFCPRRPRRCWWAWTSQDLDPSGTVCWRQKSVSPVWNPKCGGVHVLSGRDLWVFHRKRRFNTKKSTVQGSTNIEELLTRIVWHSNGPQRRRNDTKRLVVFLALEVEADCHRKPSRSCNRWFWARARSQQ